MYIELLCNTTASVIVYGTSLQLDCRSYMSSINLLFAWGDFLTFLSICKNLQHELSALTHRKLRYLQSGLKGVVQNPQQPMERLLPVSVENLLLLRQLWVSHQMLSWRIATQVRGIVAEEKMSERRKHLRKPLLFQQWTEMSAGLGNAGGFQEQMKEPEQGNKEHRLVSSVNSSLTPDLQIKYWYENNRKNV